MFNSECNIYTKGSVRSRLIHIYPQSNCLEGDNTDTSALRHDAADGRNRVNSVLVARCERALLGDLGRAVAEAVVLLGSKARLVRVKVCDDSLCRVCKRRRLDEDLGAHARVDARNAPVVARAVDVRRSEADRGQARVAVLEVVVVVRHAELALVLRSVAVRVADERDLPLSAPRVRKGESWAEEGA